MPFFFFRELQLITGLPLIWDFYISWGTVFVSLRVCVGFSIFDSVPFLLKFIFFFQQNAWTIWLQNVIILFKIKIIQSHTQFCPGFLSCNSKFFRIQWYLREVELPTSDMATWIWNLSLQNRSFENVSYFLNNNC